MTPSELAPAVPKRIQRKRKKTVSPKYCRLICWSLRGKDGKIRPEVCPECGKDAEVALDMIGRPCFFHKTREN